MNISIVIPAFNERNKIRFDVEAAVAFIQSRNWRGEVIVVDDGSEDGTSVEAGMALPPEGIDLHVLRHPQNRGKGAAVRTGILASKGQVVLYADSGSCVPYLDALSSVESILAGELDMALASRRHKNTVICRNRPLKRRIYSCIFRIATRLITGLPRSIGDSQCGFKVYDGSATRALFGRLETDGFLFEIEILLTAFRQNLRMEEFPIHWTCDHDTRLRAGHIARSIVSQLWKIRRRTLKS